jgi:hypothetical protein
MSKQDTAKAIRILLAIHDIPLPEDVNQPDS